MPYCSVLWELASMCVSSECVFVWVLVITPTGEAVCIHVSRTPALLSSVGRVGFPCTEALSSLQQPRVQVPAWGSLLGVTPPLSHPIFSVSSAVLSIKPYKAPKIYFKKKLPVQHLWVQTRLSGRQARAKESESHWKSTWICNIRSVECAKAASHCSSSSSGRKITKKQAEGSGDNSNTHPTLPHDRQSLSGLSYSTLKTDSHSPKMKWRTTLEPRCSFATDVWSGSVCPISLISLNMLQMDVDFFIPCR